MKEARTYTYKEFIDKFMPNSKCPKCGDAIPIHRMIGGEWWCICPMCDYKELDKHQIEFIKEEKK